MRDVTLVLSRKSLSLDDIRELTAVSGSAGRTELAEELVEAFDAFAQALLRPIMGVD